LIAVPLSIITKSSGKIAEFCFVRIQREKHAKTVELKQKFGICFKINLYEKTRNSGKVAEFKKKLK
jgi:hypothetical protein